MTTLRSSYVQLLVSMDESGGAKVEPVMPVEHPVAADSLAEIVYGEPVIVELLDQNRQVVLRDVVYALEVCLLPALTEPIGPERDPTPVLIGGVIPVVPDAAMWQMTLHGKVLVERAVPSKIPEVNVDWAVVEGDASRVYGLTWVTQHPEGEPVLHWVSAVIADGQEELGERTIPLTLPSTGTDRFKIESTGLPTGTQFLELSSTDGFTTVTNRSKPVTPDRQPFVAVITEPLDGSVHPELPVRLSGHGYSYGAHALEQMWLRWSLGSGEEIALGPSAEVKLPSGKHPISLQAGPPGLEGKATVTIRIEG